MCGPTEPKPLGTEGQICFSPTHSGSPATVLKGAAPIQLREGFPITVPSSMTPTSNRESCSPRAVHLGSHSPTQLTDRRATAGLLLSVTGSQGTTQETRGVTDGAGERAAPMGDSGFELLVPVAPLCPLLSHTT